MYVNRQWTRTEWSSRPQIDRQIDRQTDKYVQPHTHKKNFVFQPQNI